MLPLPPRTGVRRRAALIMRPRRGRSLAPRPPPRTRVAGAWASAGPTPPARMVPVIATAATAAAGARCTTLLRFCLTAEGSLPPLPPPPRSRLHPLRVAEWRRRWHWGWCGGVHARGLGADRCRAAAGGWLWEARRFDPLRAVRRPVTGFPPAPFPLTFLRPEWQPTGGGAVGWLPPSPPPSRPSHRPAGRGWADAPPVGRHGRVLVPLRHRHPTVGSVVEEPPCLSFPATHGVPPVRPLPAPRRGGDAAAAAVARPPPTTSAASLARASAATAAAAAAAAATAGGGQRRARRASDRRPPPSWPPRG